MFSLFAGREMLPATYVDGHIKKTEEYPTKKEINAWLKKSSEVINNGDF